MLKIQKSNSTSLKEKRNKEGIFKISRTRAHMLAQREELIKECQSIIRVIIERLTSSFCECGRLHSETLYELANWQNHGSDGDMHNSLRVS